MTQISYLVRYFYFRKSAKRPETCLQPQANLGNYMSLLTLDSQLRVPQKAAATETQTLTYCTLALFAKAAGAPAAQVVGSLQPPHGDHSCFLNHAQTTVTIYRQFRSLLYWYLRVILKLGDPMIYKTHIFFWKYLLSLNRIQTQVFDIRNARSE